MEAWLEEYGCVLHGYFQEIVDIKRKEKKSEDVSCQNSILR
jgi:hypothetical protein